MGTLTDLVWKYGAFEKRGKKWRFSQHRATKRLTWAWETGRTSRRKRRYSLLLPRKDYASLGKEARPLRDTTNLRFAGPVSTGELENVAKGVVPTSTAAATQWAVEF